MKGKIERSLIGKLFLFRLILKKYILFDGKLQYSRKIKRKFKDNNWYIMKEYDKVKIQKQNRLIV